MMLMVSDRQDKGSNAPSVKSAQVEEESMKTGHWLGSVLSIFFSVLTLLVR